MTDFDKSRVVTQMAPRELNIPEIDKIICDLIFVQDLSQIVAYIYAQIYGHLAQAPLFFGTQKGRDQALDTKFSELRWGIDYLEGYKDWVKETFLIPKTPFSRYIEIIHLNPPFITANKPDRYSFAERKIQTAKTKLSEFESSHSRARLNAQDTQKLIKQVNEVCRIHLWQCFQFLAESEIGANFVGSLRKCLNFTNWFNSA